MPCSAPEIHGRPNCKYQLREIPEREIILIGETVAAELKDHKVELRCTIICANQGPMSHVAISAIEDITRQYSTRLEREGLKKLKAGFIELGYEGRNNDV